MDLRLTRKLQLKAFARVLAVGDKLQPHAAGSAVYAGAEHFGAAKGAQQASRAIAAIVDLGGTRKTYWKLILFATSGTKSPLSANRDSSFQGSEIIPTQSLTWRDFTMLLFWGAGFPPGRIRILLLTAYPALGAGVSALTLFPKAPHSYWGKHILPTVTHRCALTLQLFKKNPISFFSFF